MLIALYKYPQTRMTEDETNLLVNVSMMETHNKTFEDHEAGHFFEIMQKRLEAYNIHCNRYAMLLLSALCNTPAEVVLYTHAVACLNKKLGREVNITDVCFAFAKGFPNTEQKLEAWRDQKGSGGNVLDQSDTWTDENLLASA